MTPKEYQRLAERTEVHPSKPAERIRETQATEQDSVRVFHSMLGITSEAGELADAVKKWIYYGQELDTINVCEELGDLLWYIALMCNALGFDLETVMEKNIAKLRQRYPEKFTEEQAAEKNRDRETERNEVATLTEQEVIHVFCNRCDRYFTCTGPPVPKLCRDCTDLKELVEGYSTKEITMNEVARNIADTYLEKKDREQALKYIERTEKENAEVDKQDPRED